MYHALVRINGRWASFGLHGPHSWTEMFHSLQLNYGSENVTYTFRHPTDPVSALIAIQFALDSDVYDANVVQSLRDTGVLPTHDDDGSLLSLAHGMYVLRESRAS